MIRRRVAEKNEGVQCGDLRYHLATELETYINKLYRS